MYIKEKKDKSNGKNLGRRTLIRALDIMVLMALIPLSVQAADLGVTTGAGGTWGIEKETDHEIHTEEQEVTEGAVEEVPWTVQERDSTEEETDEWDVWAQDNLQWEDFYDTEETETDSAAGTADASSDVLPEEAASVPTTEHIQETVNEMGSGMRVQFVAGTSSLASFPETAETEKSVQNGQKMLHLKLKKESDKGNIGVRYQKVAQKDGLWYDLKITVTDFETVQAITKEGEVTVYPDIAFCESQIAWGRMEGSGKVTLKIEFTESGTDNVMPGTSGIFWTMEGTLLPAVTAIDDQEGLQNTAQSTGNEESEISAIQDTSSQMGDGIRIVKREPKVKLIITEYDATAKRYTYETVFQVYEWNGTDYGTYRGSMIYYGKGQQYMMENLIRNEVNQGRYKVVKEDGSWEQEFLVPSLPVVTYLYYHVEC